MTEKNEKKNSSPLLQEQAMKDVTKKNEQSEASETSQTRASETATSVATRRKLINAGAAGAAAALFGLVASACGSDDDTGSPSTGGKGGSGGSSGKAGSGGKAGSTATGGSAGTAGEGGASAGSAGEAAGAGGAPDVADADIVPLNALLSAEYNAITAYSAGAGLIGGALTTDPLYPLRAVITDIAVSIQSQHKLHAAALVDAIGELNGTPVKEADVAAKFKAPAALIANPSISNVLKFAAGAERGAGVAYNQVLAGMEDAQLRFLASSIEGDETQHFIVLAALVLGLASPGANLSEATAVKVFPEAFVSTVGTHAGLDAMPADYFA